MQIVTRHLAGVAAVLGKGLLALAVIAALGALSLSPAQARYWHHHGHHWGGGYYEPYGYYAPGPYGYYNPPPVVYGPPPPSVGFSFVFP